MLTSGTKGLTLNKTYYGTPVATGQHGGYLELIVFNDAQEWKAYDIAYFEPGNDTENF